MPSFNKSFLMGNLTRDVQAKHTSGNTFVAEFGLAVNRKFKTSGGEEREEVLFIDCAAFGKTGEVINEHFHKGKPIFLEGRLKFDQWEDKKDGSKRSKISFVVENFQFVGGRDGGDGGGEQTYADARGGGSRAGDGKHANMFRKPAGTGVPSQCPQAPFGDEQHFTDDSDIPFKWSGRMSQPL